MPIFYCNEHSTSHCMIRSNTLYMYRGHTKIDPWPRHLLEPWFFDWGGDSPQIRSLYLHSKMERGYLSQLSRQMYLLPKDSSPTPSSPPLPAPTRSSLESKTEKCISRLTETLSSQNGNSESCGITHSCFFPFSDHHNKSKIFTIKDPKLR